MLDVCLLGTGGMMPLPGRWLTSLLLRYNGKLFLIDCGEGTQIPLKLAGWGFKAVDAIFFTHYHADHIAGLPGLLLTIGNSGKDTPLDLIGPPGLLWIAGSLLTICPALPYDIRVVELPCGTAANGANKTATGVNAAAGANKTAIIAAAGTADTGGAAATAAADTTEATADKSEATAAAVAAAAADTAESTATAAAAAADTAEFTAASDADSGSIDLAPHCDIELYGKLSFQYAPCEHNIPCYAYSFSIQRQGVFHPQKAKELDIPLQLWKKLQIGETVILPGGRKIEPDMVLGPARRGVKLSYCTDSRPTKALRRLFKNSDLLICEGMYGDDAERDNAREKKHMLFSEAAMLARDAGASELWLTHYSPSLQNPSEHIGAARRYFENTYPGRDLLSTTLKFKD